jgi:hypothetical protein
MSPLQSLIGINITAAEMQASHQGSSTSHPLLENDTVRHGPPRAATFCTPSTLPKTLAKQYSSQTRAHNLYLLNSGEALNTLRDFIAHGLVALVHGSANARPCGIYELLPHLARPMSRPPCLFCQTWPSNKPRTMKRRNENGHVITDNFFQVTVYYAS